MDGNRNDSVGPLGHGFGPGFDELRAELLRTPEDIEEYERDVRIMVMIRKILMAIDAERERRGMSKADLARLVGVEPSAIRRMFSSERANPTLKTVLVILATLRLDLEVQAPAAAAAEAASDSDLARESESALGAKRQPRGSARKKADKPVAA